MYGNKKVSTRQVIPELRDIPLTFSDCPENYKFLGDFGICLIAPDPLQYEFCLNIRSDVGCPRGVP